MCASSVKYFDIVVVLYSAGDNLYGHPVIWVVFCREDYEFRLIFINLQRISGHPFDTSVMQSWIRVVASCTSVVLFAHCIYIWVSSA